MTRFSGCSRFIAQISSLASFAENGSALITSWIFKIVRCISLLYILRRYAGAGSSFRRPERGRPAFYLRAFALSSVAPTFLQKSFDTDAEHLTLFERCPLTH